VSRSRPPAGRSVAPGGARARLGAEQRGHLGDIQAGPGPVHRGVKDVLHLPAEVKQQIAAVFDLVDRVGVEEASPLLVFGQVKAEGQAGGVNPRVNDLAQPPCSRILRQSVCDLGQAVASGPCPTASAMSSDRPHGAGSILRW